MKELIGRRVLVSDGAMGTMMQKYGLKTGGLPELLNFSDPDIIEGIHSAYFAAGSDFVSTNTFGASELKLKGCGYSVEEVIVQAVAIARKAALNSSASCGAKKYVALDVGPAGVLMEPVGDLTFDRAYGIYQQQILAGAKAGADLIFFETFSDLFEMKIAILAAKENCDLPILCSLTFEANGRTLMGADPLTMVNTLQDLGIDALGINCSLGPAQMIDTVKEILKYSKLPVLVQPNAGLPVVSQGETVYDVSPHEFLTAMTAMLEAGVSIVGGCCGTTPEYIAALVSKVQHMEQNGLTYQPERYNEGKPFTAVSSGTRTVILDDRIRIIGERINPTGKKLLREALKSGDLDYVEDEAIKQVKAGADILDINVGLPGIDEADMMLKAMNAVTAVVDVPLQIDSADPKVLETAVRAYNGKAIINSVNGKESAMHDIFPIVQKYGTCVIALTLDENGLPKNTAERVAIAEKIINTAAGYGIGRERIIVDCLTLTVSAEQGAALDTLAAITEVKKRFGVRTTLGASNISFGLPERKQLNRTFLAMALAAGLDVPITDPLEADYMDTIRAFEVLSGKDAESRDYISCYGNYQTAEKDKRSSFIGSGSQKKATDLSLSLHTIIKEGYEEKATLATEILLNTMHPLEIVETIIIPSLEIVGKQYETGELFLPQLIKSADTVTKAFEVLKRAMKTSGETINYGRILLATVEGDIHDIGKNIVKVLLENYGFEVLDLGKDVPIQKIIETVQSENIKLVGLSALMTTTVVNMEAAIKGIRASGHACFIAVGGAVLSADYAAKIGADYYGKDAMSAVKIANELFKEAKEKKR